MLFDTPLLNLSAKEPVASTAGPSTPASAKKRTRSSSNAAAHDGPAPQPAGQAAALPAAEINLDKLMKRMKAVEGAAGGKAKEPQQPQPRGGAREGKNKSKNKGDKKDTATGANRGALGTASTKAPEAAPSPAPSSKRQKKDKKKGKGAAAATSSADEPAALSDSPAPPKPVSAAVAQLAEQRHAAPSQVVTASTAGKSGSMQDKLRAQLAGGKFRMLNEQLYTTSGDEAHALMQEEGAFDDVRALSLFRLGHASGPWVLT